MPLLSFSRNARLLLAIIALFGLLVPNGIFLWAAFSDFPAMLKALTDPVALVFVLEAFGLMFLLAWLIHRSDLKPGWLVFVLMSLAGSLAFSVPAWLWLASRKRDVS